MGEEVEVTTLLTLGISTAMTISGGDMRNGRRRMSR